MHYIVFNPYTCQSRRLVEVCAIFKLQLLRAKDKGPFAAHAKALASWSTVRLHDHVFVKHERPHGLYCRYS